MEKIHSNKEFAIGTKIEYNGKLYEVIEQKYCENCSIASICTNTDISSGNRIGDVISREQRLNIFGECSSVARSDGKSVVFVEIIDSIKETNVQTIVPLYKDFDELKDIKIHIPKDYQIDTIHSDLSKGIIKFKSKWLTLEQLYKLAEENNFNTYRDSIKNIVVINYLL